MSKKIVIDISDPIARGWLLEGWVQFTERCPECGEEIDIRLVVNDIFKSHLEKMLKGDEDE